MRRYNIVILSVLIAFISRGCKDTPVDVQDSSPMFHARVVDSHNNPIADVGFHYIFYFGNNIHSRELLIEYQLQSADTITVKIADSFGNSMGTINRGYEQAGNHSIRYYVSFFSNGIYYFTVSGKTINQRLKMFVRTDDITELIQTSPFAKTDANGNLQIPYSVLGIGEQLTFQNDSTHLQLTIGDSIRVVLFKPYYQWLVTQYIILDTTKTFQTTFQLQDN